MRVLPVALIVAALPAFAQTPAPGAPGAPAIAPAASALPSAAALPPRPAAHSPVAASAAAPTASAVGASAGAPSPAGTAPPAPAPAPAPQNPHNLNTAPQDESLVAPDLPAGTIDAQILDVNRQPVARRRVRLGIMFQKISEGESRSERFATTDDAGRVRFSDLKTGSEYSYRITVKEDRADYGSAPFNLSQQAGQRVVLHVFPVTSDLQAARVGVRGMLYIEPRDDVFQLEALFRVFNVGLVTWVPSSDIVVRLPEGFKAFSSQRDMTGAGFTQVDGVGARLEGTYAPGQYDVRFRFQLPKEGQENAVFRVGLLPRLLDVRVIAEASSRMSMSVDGFPPAEVESNPQGKRILMTGMSFARSEPIDAVVVNMGGLPVPGPGRWIAVLLASALGVTGFAAFRGKIQLESGGVERRDRDLDAARELLLAEIVEIERAHRHGELGPRAYADARRTLLESLARLGREALTPRKTKRRRAEA